MAGSLSCRLPYPGPQPRPSGPDEPPHSPAVPPRGLRGKEPGAGGWGRSGQLWEGRDGAPCNNRILHNTNRPPSAPPSPSCFLESLSHPSPLVNSSFGTHSKHAFPDRAALGCPGMWGRREGTEAQCILSPNVTTAVRPKASSSPKHFNCSSPTPPRRERGRQEFPSLLLTTGPKTQ